MNTLCEDYRSFFSVSQDTEQQYSGAYSAITAYKSGQNGVLYSLPVADVVSSSTALGLMIHQCRHFRRADSETLRA